MSQTTRLTGIMHPVRPAAFHRKRLTMQVRKRSLVDRHEQDPNAFGLLLARRFQGAASFAAAASHFDYRFQESAGGVSSFMLRAPGLRTATLAALPCISEIPFPRFLHS